MAGPLPFLEDPRVLAGIVVGLAVLGILSLWLLLRRTRRVVEATLRETRSQHQQETEAILQRVRDAFGSLALEVLTKNNEAFLQLAGERLGQHTRAAAGELEGKRQLIDQSMESVRAELKKMEGLVTSLERDRQQKYGELAEQLKAAAEHTGRLQETTYQLREALASSRARGQWGERMADDVLRLSGFLEGINYRKQKTLEGGRGRPDFTFLLPGDLCVHMDVKFPFDNYLRFLETREDTARGRLRDRFLKDVRGRVKEITTREYINPEENTLDYAILFIPNEQVYAFIQEEDSSLLDDALKSHVILCSPLTLYAMLTVIRQSVENFHLEKRTSEILAQMGRFDKQWEAFVRSMEKMGKRIEDAQKEYEHLTTTRRNQLDRPLRELNRIRTEREGLPAPEDEIEEEPEEDEPEADPEARHPDG